MRNQCGLDQIFTIKRLLRREFVQGNELSKLLLEVVRSQEQSLDSRVNGNIDFQRTRLHIFSYC